MPEAEGYQALAQAATAQFAEVSRAINEIEAQLRSLGGAASALASTIRQLQELEKQKLTLTAQQHIVRHGLAVDALSTEAAIEAGGDVSEKVGGGGSCDASGFCPVTALPIASKCACPCMPTCMHVLRMCECCHVIGRLLEPDYPLTGAESARAAKRRGCGDLL